VTMVMLAAMACGQAMSQAMTKGIMSPPANVRPPHLQNAANEHNTNAQNHPDPPALDENSRPGNLANNFGTTPLTRNPATSPATAIMVLTPQGRISRYFYGVDYPPKDLRMGLVEASQNKIGNAVDQVLLCCYHYDPETGKYGAVITNILRLGAGFTVVLLVGL